MIVSHWDNQSKAGLKAENAHLYCVSEGIEVVIRASLDIEAFAKTAKLRPEQTVIITQTIGYLK